MNKKVLFQEISALIIATCNCMGTHISKNNLINSGCTTCTDKYYR